MAIYAAEQVLGNNIPGSGPLRDDGRAPTVSSSRATRDLPSTTTPMIERQAYALEMVRDIWGGTETIRALGQKYLPREPAEDAGNYSVRLRRSVFFNVFRHTVEGLAGFVFRKDPVLGSDVPKVMQEHWENIDNAGTHGDVFARALLTDAMTAGHAGILVEYPNTGDVPLTVGDERDLQLRPYWVAIKKDDIVSVRMRELHGKSELEQMVLCEKIYVPDGAYGEKAQTQYRVLYKNFDTGEVGWRVEMVSEDGKQVVVQSQGLFRNQVQIPVTEVATAGKMGSWVSRPPFLDLAYLNIAHYQQWSDYATCIHKTNVPILVTSGVEVEGALIVGPNTGLNFSAPDAKAYYVAHDGHALASSKASLDDLKNDMAALGLAALANSKRVAETAVAKEIDKSASDASLSVTARGAQDAIEQAFDFHARYLMLDDGGSIQINREFGDTRILATDVQAWIALAKNLGVPLMAVLSALRTGGWIPDDANLEEISREAMANVAAAQASASPTMAGAGRAADTEDDEDDLTAGTDPAVTTSDTPTPA